MARAVSVRRSTSSALPVDEAYARVLSMQLSLLFTRFGPLPAVTGVRDQDGAWDRAGQTRVVELGDGSEMTEELVSVQPGVRFDYRLTGLTGPVRFLVDHVDGRWAFDPKAAGGTTVIWSWRMHPRTTAAYPGVLALGLLWRGYARRALARLGAVLDARPSP